MVCIEDCFTEAHMDKVYIYRCLHGETYKVLDTLDGKYLVETYTCDGSRVVWGNDNVLGYLGFFDKCNFISIDNHIQNQIKEVLL